MNIIPTYKDVTCIICNKVLHGYDRTCNAQKVHKGKCRDTLRTNTNRSSSRAQRDRNAKSELPQDKSARFIKPLEKAGIYVPPGTVILNKKWVKYIIAGTKKAAVKAELDFIELHLLWERYVDKIGSRKCVGTGPKMCRLLDYHTYISSKGERGVFWSHDGNDIAYCHVHSQDGKRLFEYDRYSDTFTFLQKDAPSVTIKNVGTPLERAPGFDIESFRKYLKYVTPFVLEGLAESLCKRLHEPYRRPPWLESILSRTVLLKDVPPMLYHGCQGRRENLCSGKDERDRPCHVVIDPNNLPDGCPHDDDPYKVLHYGSWGWVMPTYLEGARKPVEPLPEDTSEAMRHRANKRLDARVKREKRARGKRC